MNSKIKFKKMNYLTIKVYALVVLAITFLVFAVKITNDLHSKTFSSLAILTAIFLLHYLSNKKIENEKN